MSALGIIAIIVFFTGWYYCTGDGSDVIQPIDVLLLLGCAVIVVCCYAAEWMLRWKIKGGEK